MRSILHLTSKGIELKRPSGKKEERMTKQMNSAFAIFVGVGTSRQEWTGMRSKRVSTVVKAVEKRRCALHMKGDNEEPLSAAEQTRRALTEAESLIQFRREVEISDDEKTFRYTTGTTEGGLDIWLVTAILTIVVPAVGFAIGVATGNIDINPR